ncbi:MAG: hypothetical protein GEV00_23635 [Actinophytocola sp.]|nr:hypothetical protein [Actinophytocola sp.]
MLSGNCGTATTRATPAGAEAAGHDVTFTAVAQTAGISRATCYRNRELRAIIDTYRSRHGDILTLTALADRVDNLTQTLHALADKVRHQEEEIRSLKRATQPPARRSQTPD